MKIFNMRLGILIWYKKVKKVCWIITLHMTNEHSNSGQIVYENKSKKHH